MSMGSFNPGTCTEAGRFAARLHPIAARLHSMAARHSRPAGSHDHHRPASIRIADALLSVRIGNRAEELRSGWTSARTPHHRFSQAAGALRGMRQRDVCLGTAQKTLCMCVTQSAEILNRQAFEGSFHATGK